MDNSMVCLGPLNDTVSDLLQTVCLSEENRYSSNLINECHDHFHDLLSALSLMDFPRCGSSAAHIMDVLSSHQAYQAHFVPHCVQGCCMDLIHERALPARIVCLWYVILKLGTGLWRNLA